METIANLGPLAPLAGRWEGEEGLDVAPARGGGAKTRFREEILFEPMGPVVNGPQTVYGLRYSTTAWPLGEPDPFHEEVGYWLWDGERQTVMRLFTVPRGVTVVAGGRALPDARAFRMEASLGSTTFGILSSPFLDQAFRTIHYELDVRVLESGEFEYREDTVLQLEGAADPFHHTDENRLRRLAEPVWD